MIDFRGTQQTQLSQAEYAGRIANLGRASKLNDVLGLHLFIHMTNQSYQELRGYEGQPSLDLYGPSRRAKRVAYLRPEGPKGGPT